jgi:hypothetical protein
LDGSLVISQPAGPALALVLAGLLAALVQRRRANAHRSFLRSLLMIATLAAVAWLLVSLGSPAAHAALILLAVLCGGWLTWSLYRAERVGGARRVVLVSLRVVVWLVLLALLSRPAWERVVRTWDKPVLAVLLDQSESMGMADASPAAATRAVRVNAILQQAGALQDRLTERYDVHLLDVGTQAEPATRWRIMPRAPITALAAALRTAGELRSTRGQPPAAVLIISDGAENAGSAAELRAAAERLAQQRTRLLAVGAGPTPGQAPLVQLDPLVLPARVGLRDRLHVPASGRLQGCAGHALPIELLWDETVTQTDTLPADRGTGRFERGLDTMPPAPGAHRLTVRVRLPQGLGGHTFATSTVVDVVGEQIRVLWIEQGLHQESAFAIRAIRRDPRLQVTRLLWYEPDPPADALQRIRGTLGEHDVIVLGRVGPHLPEDLLAAMVATAAERGAGLLLCGGRDLLNRRDYVASPLRDASPLDLSDAHFGLPGPQRFAPTVAGRQHPLFAGDAGDVWDNLPALGGVADVGSPKPAAAILATNDAGTPLLAAQEVGRGRCVTAAWEATWPWALASDAGAAVHTRLWQQLVTWLANRRPQAWVITERPTYAEAALASGQTVIRVRAGITGLDETPPSGSARAANATLTVRQVAGYGGGETFPITLAADGAAWTASLPGPVGDMPPLSPGTYELTFRASVRTRAGDREGSDLDARTQFSVVAASLEHQPPTADLGLLKSAAERTASVGGRFAEVEKLPELLAELAARDDRQRIATTVRRDLVDEDPWGLLAWLSAALAVEWSIRKRSGLA